MTESNLPHPTYRPDIDGLRAIAVTSVVLYHAFPDWLWMRGGFVGVDMFFTISGFLISSIILRELETASFSFIDFYARRVRRIFPALLIVLVTCLAFSWLVLLPDEYQQLAKHALSGIFFTSNLTLWQEVGYFDNQAETKPLLHLWSLGIEEQFYIVWPAILYFLHKNYKKFLLPAILLLLIASLSLNLWLVRESPSTTFYLPVTRVWELLAGSLLAHLYSFPCFTTSGNEHSSFWKIKNLFKKINPNTLATIGTVALLFSLREIKKDFNFPGGWAIIPTFGAICIIAAGEESWFNRKVLSSRAFVWLGLISFPLYLWHWPLLSFYRIIEINTPHWAVRVTLVFASVFLAWCTYYCIEARIRKKIAAKQSIKPLLLISAVVGLISISVYLSNGIPSRSVVQGYTNNSQDLERTPSTDNACANYIGLNHFSFSYCRFTNATSASTIAVIGDSHAHAAYPGIAYYAKEGGINTVLLAGSGCPLYLGTATGATESERNLCTQQTKEVISAIIAKPDIKKIFFITRGAYYLAGTEPYAQATSKLPSFHIDLHNYQTGLQSSIETLVKAGKEVIYVTENPELQHDVRACISRPLRKATENCSVEKIAVEGRFREYRQLLRNINNATIVDGTDIFCPEKMCKIFDNGSLLYADDDHLSVSGSYYLAKQSLRKYIN